MKRFLVLAGVGMLLALSPARAAAQPDPKKPALKVRWFGQSFFQVETSTGKKIVFDPHAIAAFGRQTTTANYVLISHTHDDHNVIGVVETPDKGKIKEGDVFRGITETKTGKQDWKTFDEKRGDLRFRTVATYHDTQNGLQRGKNSVWVLEADGLVVCHLGDLGHELTAEQLKAIGKVDVLMVPIGGIYTINGEQAQKVVSQIKPRLYVLPMHFGVPGFDDLAGPQEFLDGQKNVKKMPGTNELVVPLDMKADAPTIVMLGWKKPEEKKEEPKKEQPKKP